MPEESEIILLIHSKKLPSRQSATLNDDVFCRLLLSAVVLQAVNLFQNCTVSTLCDPWIRAIIPLCHSSGSIFYFAIDFIKHDVSRLYKDLLPYVKITLVEAGPVLLGPFDAALQKYAHGLFKKRDIDVRLGIAVTGVEELQVEGFHFPNRRAMLSDGTSLEFGTMVWSAGLAPRNFTKSLDGILPKHPRNGRILVDPYLRVKGYEGSIWACGDAAVNEQGIIFPQLAQVARQQGIYLAKVLNGKQREDEKEFHFFSLGSMAYVGDLKGIYDGTTVGEPGKEIKHPRITGLLALLMWRFAYWGRQTSMVNKMLIPMHWFKSFLFGRGK